MVRVGWGWEGLSRKRKKAGLLAHFENDVRNFSTVWQNSFSLSSLSCLCLW